MIYTKSLRIDYDNVTAVHDLDLEISAGQIYGLVGPNGAGKTSTIKALAGIIEPTYGDIKINGIDLELSPQQALLNVGYMPDFPPVYENLKVWEYLDVFATAYLIKRSERMERIQYWIKKVNLQDKTESLVKELSRGMRQRLILAKTLVHDPKVLLMDEPASGLDPIARREMRDILKEVAAQGKTIIISSHILTELSDLCNAVGIMEKGRMVASGTVENIRAKVGSKGQLIIKLANPSLEKSVLCMEYILGCPHAANARKEADHCFYADYLADSNEASALLSALVQAGVPIKEFQVKEATVEDIFYKIGAREVS